MRSQDSLDLFAQTVSALVFPGCVEERIQAQAKAGCLQTGM